MHTIDNASYEARRIDHLYICFDKLPKLLSHGFRGQAEGERLRGVEVEKDAGKYYR